VTHPRASDAPPQAGLDQGDADMIGQVAPNLYIAAGRRMAIAL